MPPMLPIGPKAHNNDESTCGTSKAENSKWVNKISKWVNQNEQMGKFK